MTSIRFPFNSVGDGSIAIPETKNEHAETKKLSENEPGNAWDTDYSTPYEHPLQKIASGYLCSLYANSEGKDINKRKLKCDDAFAVHFSKDYPFVFIADGGFGSCDPEHIKQISIDPHIVRLILEFQETLTNNYGKMGFDTPELSSELARKLIRDIVTYCSKNYTYTPQGEYTAKASEFTFTLAIPFQAKDRPPEVITFGIGNDEVFLHHKDGNVEPLRRLTRYYEHDGHLSISPPPDSKKLDQQPRLLDKVLVPPRNLYQKKCFEEALTLMDVRVTTFQESDVLFATTDGFSKIINDYHDALEKLKEIEGEEEKKGQLSSEEKSSTSCLDKVEQLQMISAEEIVSLPAATIQKTLSAMHHKTLEIDKRYYQSKFKEISTKEGDLKKENFELLSQCERKKDALKELRRKKTAGESIDGDQIKALESEVNVLQRSVDQNINKKAFDFQEKVLYKRGDDEAFVQVVLDKTKWSDENRWNLVATPETVLDIIKDKEYWQSKTIFGTSLPDGISAMQKELKKQKPDDTIKDIFSKMKPLATQRQYKFWTYWLTSRKHEAQYLYDIVSGEEKNFSNNEKFQKLFVDWVKHSGPRRMAQTKREWLETSTHTHNASDDLTNQGPSK